MKSIVVLSLASAVLLTCITGFYQPPMVSHNVAVMENATQSQCYNFRGRVGPEQDEMTYTRFGEDTTMAGPGVRTCRGCTVNPSNKECVCKTCYDYFDGL